MFIYLFREYGPVKNVQERRTYRLDFEKTYDEYLDLHRQLSHIDQRFKNLKVLVDDEQDGSPSQQVIT